MKGEWACRGSAGGSPVSCPAEGHKGGRPWGGDQGSLGHLQN